MDECNKSTIVLRRSDREPKSSNRLKQGVSATIGAFALLGLTAYKGYYNRGKEPDFNKLFRFSGIVSGVLGGLWASTPAAKEDPQESIAGLKENIYPIVTAVAKKAAESAVEEESGREVKEEENRSKTYSRRPYSSGTVFSHMQNKPTRDYSFNDEDLSPHYTL